FNDKILWPKNLAKPASDETHTATRRCGTVFYGRKSALKTYLLNPDIIDHANAQRHAITAQKQYARLFQMEYNTIDTVPILTQVSLPIYIQKMSLSELVNTC